ncbi:MAG: hypothetical protein CME93_04140 [Hyphomonadaceae bacterium]|nr:hypothetical protein [Hyphomonadaceae bacterium]MAV50136.1 hypothetical protein [Hyphomonadaceae bacterium]OUX94573.1 MAG: hypothetical protein CBB77_05715 [Hyphomonas sp. TMED17]CAI8419702.1 MAG: Uncharacterised protein [Hyphomonas sp. TMED17]
MTNFSAITPERALVKTLLSSGYYARHCLDQHDYLPWLNVTAVLAAQQAATLALSAVGDLIPEQSGATEILLRATSPARLPPPYTLSLSTANRRAFDGLVTARNAFMHPRARPWHITALTLSRGLPVICNAVRHLVIIQPAVPDMITPSDVTIIETQIADIEALAVFLRDD